MTSTRSQSQFFLTRSTDRAFLLTSADCRAVEPVGDVFEDILVVMGFMESPADNPDKSSIWVQLRASGRSRVNGGRERMQRGVHEE